MSSISFADDVALVASSLGDLETLIAAYLQWCALLGLKVTKVQAWTNLPGRWAVQAGGLEVKTSPSFKMVGVVFGANEQLATKSHLQPRLEKALATARRLRMLELPASVCSLLWRSAVLPQAVYGCEVRDVRPSQVAALTSAGQAAVAAKMPLHLNGWRAPEVLMGPPLGPSAVREPMLEVRERQLRWLQVLANLPTLVGLVHRLVAGSGTEWQEPPGALAAALQAVGWQLRRNGVCLRAAGWPVIAPEPQFAGLVHLQPVDTFPQVDAVFTDGSVMSSGGAAAVQEDTATIVRRRVLQPRSSTHCELVALGLGMELQPPQMLTDSLAALHLIKGWGSWSVERMLHCADRREVRWLLTLAAGCPQLVLEKVQAHDSAALALGHPKAVGNDSADHAARLAASSGDVPKFAVDLSPFGDPVELVDAGGAVVLDVRSAVASLWWERRQTSRSVRRPWLDKLYPLGEPLNWVASNVAFHRPVVAGGQFVHPVPPPVVKWLARVRAGCLASRLRLFSHRLGSSPACPCCGWEEEDEEHVVSGCPATGSADWLEMLQEVWGSVSKALAVPVDPPPVAVLEQFRLPLLAALCPVALETFVPLPPHQQAQFFRRLHTGVALQLAEWLRRREAIIASAASPSPASPAAPSLQSSCPLPRERQLAPETLRQLEVQRRSAPPTVPSPASSSGAAPPSGEPRRRWLRGRLERLIQEDTLPCPEAEAVAALTILAVFESVTGEVFADTIGTKLASRVAGIGRALGNVTREVVFSPPLLQYNRRGRAAWNRRPRVELDVAAWKAGVLAQEDYATHTVRSRAQMAESNAGLLHWVRHHRYLTPVEVDVGESGMALLILWEVDHGRPFPRHGGDGPTAALVGFTRRLKARVQQDAELAGWLVCQSFQRALAPGLPAVHHLRWSVKVQPPPPGEPQGWYTEFVCRWRQYLAGLMAAPAVVPGDADVATSSTAAGPLALVMNPRDTTEEPQQPGRRARRPPDPASPSAPSQRPLKRHRRGGLTPNAEHSPSPSPPVAAPVDPPSAPQEMTPAAPRPCRSGDPEVLPPPKRRQGDLRRWLRPPSAPEDVPLESQSVAPQPVGQGRHGRAVEGAPT